MTVRAISKMMNAALRKATNKIKKKSIEFPEQLCYNKSNRMEYRRWDIIYVPMSYFLKKSDKKGCPSCHTEKKGEGNGKNSITV